MFAIPAGLLGVGALQDLHKDSGAHRAIASPATLAPPYALSLDAAAAVSASSLAAAFARAGGGAVVPAAVAVSSDFPSAGAMSWSARVHASYAALLLDAEQADRDNAQAKREMANLQRQINQHRSSSHATRRHWNKRMCD
jgi:hypothetical protein